jgi:hypothetical protein
MFGRGKRCITLNNAIFTVFTIFFFLDDNLFHVLYKIHYIVNKNNDHPFPLNNGNKGKKAKTQNT